MAGLSPFGEELILTALLTGVDISLHSGDPGDDGSDEIVGNGYARTAYGAFSFTGGDPTVAANDASVEFPVATGAQGLITHYGFWSGSDFLGGKTLTVSKTVTLDDILRFPAGSLTFTTDDV